MTHDACLYLQYHKFLVCCIEQTLQACRK